MAARQPRFSRRRFIGWVGGGVAAVAGGLGWDRLAAFAQGGGGCRPNYGECAYAIITCVAGVSYGGFDCYMFCCDATQYAGCVFPYQVCCDAGTFYNSCDNCDCANAIDLGGCGCP